MNGRQASSSKPSARPEAFDQWPSEESLWKVTEQLKEDAWKPICPYCGGGLKKMPSRKSKCPHCENPILARAIPGRGHVLLTESEVEPFERIRSMTSGVTDGIREAIGGKEDLDLIRGELQREDGKEPDEYLVRWQLLNKWCRRDIGSSDWGMWRCDLLGKAELLRGGGYFERSLAFYMRVLYLDINGPENTDRDPSRRPFILKNAVLAPFVMEKIAQLCDYLGKTKEDLRDLFILEANPIFSTLRCPLSPDKAWERVQKKIVLEGDARP